uniref:G protein-coupled receptor 179 n=1 Tax=Podarcis muralis TaxID=64176 RepID=A0A670J999_PODMU|nr:probable G-protein coupled receptor 179 [Podarcis muralis]
MEICLLGFLVGCFHLELLGAAGIFQYQRAAPPKARTPKAKEWMPSSPSPSPLSPSSSALTFTWVPTPNLEKTDPDGSEAAAAFLYSGKALHLLQANCTRRFEVRDTGKASGPPPALRSYLRGATETLAHATNFLNMVFQTNDIRESSVKEDIEWYHALVRSVMDGDPQVYRAVLTFDAHPVSSKPQLMLQATKENNEILLQDLSASAESLRNLTWENEWYNFFRFQRAPSLYKRILTNDLKTLDTPKWSQGDSYVMDTSHIKWSPPFLECEDGKFLPNWMVTLSSSFYGLKPDLNPEFKGVLRMDVRIQKIDINQCASGQGWFANTHQCDLNSTQCIPQENKGFVLGKYLCQCKPGFYRASRTFSSSNNGESASRNGATDSESLLECLPCREGCTTCTDGTPCLIQEDWSLRAAVLAFQAFCMLAVFFSMLISYHFRKSKRIRASGVILLEMILFGSLLLYFPVFILYFKPSIFRCIVLRWVRMLGFAIVYGTITLKLYRVLKVFLSRTAQRVPYMSSGRVLKMLALILLLVLWFLAAWTVGMLENIEKNIPLVVRSQTTRGLQFYICDHDRWDYMMVVAEMLFLFWGSFLCYATRTVPSAFHEPRYMGIALHNELITSAAFHVVRFFMVPSLHPDWTLLLFFIHTHVTTTMTLALLFIPKFLHAGSPLREEIAAEVYEDELDLRRSGSYLNSSITSAWSEHSLDPDDIRDELKKLYTQLEVHKTKKMTANNPHLQKKRSSKRGLGRSLMRRITEIPESMSRQHSKEEKDGSVGGGSRSGSYKRRPLDSGSSSMKLKEDSSSRHKVASSLKKSYSTYEHVRDAKENSLPARHDSCKEAPLLDSLMRKKLAKKASERSNSDSLDDSAPLVYKSASAHNLTADKKPLHPRPSPLQKSLSVVTSAKEKALLLTSRAYLEDGSKLAQDKGSRAAVESDSAMESDVSGHTEVTDVASEVAAKQLQRDDTSEGTVSSLLEDGSSSREAATAPSTPSESRSQKHVTYASIRSISVNTSDLLGKRHPISKKIPPEPPVRQQSLAHSLKRKDSAPQDGLDQMQPSSEPCPGDLKDGPMLANICPWETEEPLAKAETERTRQAEGAVPLSSPVALNRLASMAAEVCPWEVMEVPVPSKKDSETSESDSQKSSPEKQPQASISKSSMKGLGMAIKAFNRSRIKTSIRARKDAEESQKKNEKDANGKSEKPKLAATASVSAGGGSPRKQVIAETRAKVVSKQATICPWDEKEEEEEALPTTKNSPSKALEVCPWEVSTEAIGSQGDGEMHPSRLERSKSQRESVCPWESVEEDQKQEGKTATTPSLVVSKADSKKAEACPWEVAEIPASTKTDQPSWGTSSALTEDKAVTEGRGKPSDGPKKGTSLREALPSESQEKADSRDIKEPSLGTEIEKSPDLSKGDRKKPGSVESRRAQVSPWESEEVDISVKTQICPWEMEELPSKIKTSREENEGSSKETKSTTLLRPSGGKEASRQEDSVCPWESMELPGGKDAQHGATLRKSDSGADVKAVICPWEMSDAASEKVCGVSGEGSKGTEGKKIKSPLSKNRKLERDSSYQSTVCPWEDAGAEGSSTKPATQTQEPPKAALKASSNGEGKKLEVCPWETEAAAVCPWEAAAPSLEKGPNWPEGEPSKGIILQAPHPLKTREGNIQRGSVCPWEDVELEGTLLKPCAKALDPSNVSSKKPDSFQSKKAEVAPWEAQEAEAGIRTASTVSKEEKTGPRDTAPEKRSSGTREPVCPWESTGREDSLIQPKLKSPDLSKGSLKLDRVESQKAEICPWETASADVGAKAEICPWEVPPAQSERRSSKQDANGAAKVVGDATSKPLEKASSPRESICPWETVDTDDPSTRPSAKSPGPSKAGSKKSISVESLKVEVCPWESQDAEPSPKADVCPWEMPSSPVGKRPSPEGAGARESQRAAPLNQVGASKTTEKVRSTRESACPWDSAEEPGELSAQPEGSKIPTKKSDSVESLKAEVCPWEVAERSAVGKEEEGGVAKGKDGSRSPSPRVLWKPMEELSSSREDICPWESMELDEPSGRSGGQSPALSKAGSRKSDSAESLRAEVCPWEMEEEEASSTMDICPWSVATAPFEKGKGMGRPLETSQGKKGKAQRSPDSKKAGGGTFKKIEKSKSHQEYGGTRESMDFEKPPAKSTRSLDLLQVRTEVTSPQESICPWESVELSSSRSPDLSRASSKKSSSAESLRAEVCPWEVEDEESSGKTDMFPVKMPPAPVARGASMQDAKGASTAKALTAPGLKTAGGEIASKKIEKTQSHQGFSHPQKTGDEFSVKGSKSLDLSKVGSMKSESVESLKAEVCPWETQEFGSPAQVEVCPWDLAGALFEKGTLSKDVGAVSKEGITAGSKGPEKPPKPLQKGTSIRENICPWESTDAAEVSIASAPATAASKKPGSTESRKTEVCPWETDQPEASTKEDVCPWEAGTLLPTKNERHPTHTGGTEKATASVKSSQSKEAGLAGHKPLCRSLPPQGLSKGSSLLVDTPARCQSDRPVADVCPWEAEGDSVLTGGETAEISKSFSEVCPWDEPGPATATATSMKSKGKESGAGEVEGPPSKAKSDICPWDCD